MNINIGHFLSKRALLNPTREALIDYDSGRRVTYRELNDRVNQVAGALLEHRVSKGDRVATLVMNGAESLETFFAAAKIGGVLVPLNWRLVADELAFILADSGARVLVFGHEFKEVVAELHSRGSELSIDTWVQVGGSADRLSFAVGYEEILAESRGAEPTACASDEDLLFIMYTSGTTGTPKGVMHSHSTTMWASLTSLVTADIRFGDRYLICLPLFHVGALSPLISTLHKGGSVFLMKSFDPERVWRALDKESINITLAVPAMLNFMLSTHRPEDHDTSALRWIMCGASPVPKALIEEYAALGIEVHQVYGLTESGGPACLISPDEAISRAGSTGKPFFHTEVKIVDPTSGQAVKHDTPGEIWIRGPHIMQGYWKRPEATAEAISEGWLRTGDIAVMDSDGYVFIRDRIKDMIISGGENVYPAEIENILSDHPGVGEVAVIGVGSERWGESPMAIVVRRDPSLSAEDVLSFCEPKLASFKRPKQVEFVDVLPRNPTGKVLKQVLRDRFASSECVTVT